MYIYSPTPTPTPTLCYSAVHVGPTPLFFLTITVIYQVTKENSLCTLSFLIIGFKIIFKILHA